MIVVIRLNLSGSDHSRGVAITHHASLSDGLAVAASHPPPGASYLVEGGQVARLRPSGLQGATGCQIIALHDAISGEKLYRFITRPIALMRLLEVLEEKYPAPDVIEELPTISCREIGCRWVKL